MRIGLVLGVLLLATPLAFASDEKEDIVVSGTACEKLSLQESKAAVRTRAAEVAAFNGVQAIAQLQHYKINMPIQDFNSKIYQLTDDYLSSLSINTVNQNDNEICVEINAFLAADDIKKVFASEKSNQENSSENETQLNDDEVMIGLPPKPNITINQDIAYTDEPEEDVVEVQLQEPVAVAPLPKQVKPVNNKDDVVVFVERTDFFDGNSTAKFFGVLKKDIEQTSGITAVDKSDNPDYILKTKVLKAKVVSLNAETNRMQVVVSLTLTEVKTMDTITEHQNRFILFNASDDPQKTAAALITKLFATGIAKITANIKTKNNDLANGSIITPNK